MYTMYTVHCTVYNAHTIQVLTLSPWLSNSLKYHLILNISVITPRSSYLLYISLKIGMMLPYLSLKKGMMLPYISLKKGMMLPYLSLKTGMMLPYISHKKGMMLPYLSLKTGMML